MRAGEGFQTGGGWGALEHLRSSSARTASTTDDSRAGESAERRRWDGAAERLRIWWPAFHAFMAPVTSAMIEQIDLCTGDRVLDVATGFGEPALTLASVVGPSGHVVASDLSPMMLAVASERARSLGLVNVTVAEMDGQCPTATTTGFDAITCRLGLMFMADPNLALQRLTALLTPGGSFVAAVWGPAEANPSITLAATTLQESLRLPRIGLAAHDIFALNDPADLRHALVQAGLEKVGDRRIGLSFVWPSAEAYVAYHRHGPLGGSLTDVEPSAQEAAWRAVHAAAARHLHRGSLRLRGEVIVVSGRRPTP